METMTVREASARYPVAVVPRVLRRPHAATFVMALYVALVLAAPGLVRFAPELDTGWLSAVTWGQPPIHCAAIASVPSACQALNVAAAGPVVSVN